MEGFGMRQEDACLSELGRSISVESAEINIHPARKTNPHTFVQHAGRDAH